MKKVDQVQRTNPDDYYAVVDEKGVMRCSCGRELVKMDENTYKCPGGYPIYRFEDGSIFIDKWGNLMLKTSDHDGGEQDEEK